MVIKRALLSLSFFIVLIGLSGCMGSRKKTSTIRCKKRWGAAGKINRAQRILNKIETKNILATKNFDDEATILDTIQDVKISSEWPLISAFNELNVLLIRSKKAIDLAHIAKQANSGFAHEANKLIARAEKIVNNISNTIKIIRNNKNYFGQLKLYKKEMQHKEKMMKEYQFVSNTLVDVANIITFGVPEE